MNIEIRSEQGLRLVAIRKLEVLPHLPVCAAWFSGRIAVSLVMKGEFYSPDLKQKVGDIVSDRGEPYCLLLSASFDHHSLVICGGTNASFASTAGLK